MWSTKEHAHHRTMSNELIDVVKELNRSCPWTLSVSPSQMLEYAKTEIQEIRDEIETLKLERPKKSKTNENKDATPLESELGDLLFDALMLVSICEREYPSEVRGFERVWSQAARKIKSRTPYMKKWREDDSCVAKTKEDAERIWLKKKRQEKKTKNAFHIMMKASRRKKTSTNVTHSACTPTNDNEKNSTDISIIKKDFPSSSSSSSSPSSSYVVDARPSTREAQERCRNMNRNIQNFFSSVKRKKRKTFLAYDKRTLLHKPSAGHRHPEVPDRVAVIWKSLESYIPKCELVTSTPISTKDILRCHERTYIKCLENLRSEKQPLASDTYHNEHTLDAAKIAAGCTLNLTKRLLEENKANGYCVTRPPGHHCSHVKTHGFCILNNVAIAARYASCEKNKRVVVFDWDVHHGDGTEQILRSDPNVLYISIHRHESGKFFPFTGAAHEHAKTSVNVAWSQKGMGDDEYAVAFHHVVIPLIKDFRADLVLVSAGFDAAAGDPLGGNNVTASFYGYMTHVLCQLFKRVGLVLEGGYSLGMLSACSLECVKSLLGKNKKYSVESSKSSRRYFLQESAFLDIENTISIQRKEPRGMSSSLSHLKCDLDLYVLCAPVLFECSDVMWNDDVTVEIKILSLRDMTSSSSSSSSSNVCALMVYKDNIACCSILLDKSVELKATPEGGSWQLSSNQKFKFESISNALKFASVVSNYLEKIPSEPLVQHFIPHIRPTRAWIVSDGKNVLASSRVDDVLSCGVLTKLMSLYVALRSKKFFDDAEKVLITTKRLKLKLGDSMPLRDVAIGMLMCKGTGFATLLAEHTSESLEVFVKTMNEEALRLGMSKTRFVDPHGMSADNVSTCRDMELLCRACVSSFWFPLCSIQRHKRWRSNNRLLAQPRTESVRQVDGLIVERYPKAMGTSSALSFIRRSDGKRVLVIVLNASCSVQVALSESRSLGEWGGCCN